MFPIAWQVMEMHECNGIKQTYRLISHKVLLE